MLRGTLEDTWWTFPSYFQLLCLIINTILYIYIGMKNQILGSVETYNIVTVEEKMTLLDERST